MRKNARPEPAAGNYYRQVSNGHIVTISTIEGNQVRCIDSGYQGMGPFVSVTWSLGMFDLKACGTFRFLGTT